MKKKEKKSRPTRKPAWPIQTLSTSFLLVHLCLPYRPCPLLCVPSCLLTIFLLRTVYIHESHIGVGNYCNSCMRGVLWPGFEFGVFMMGKRLRIAYFSYISFSYYDVFPPLLEKESSNFSTRVSNPPFQYWWITLQLYERLPPGGLPRENSVHKSIAQEHYTRVKHKGTVCTTASCRRDRVCIGMKSII